MIGTAVIILAALVVFIYVLIEVKRLRHKVFALFLIALLIFSYISFSLVIKGRNIDFASVGGLTTATKLYFSWLGSVFGNMKSLTTNAIRMDWKGNETGG